MMNEFRVILGASILPHGVSSLPYGYSEVSIIDWEFR